jgi:YVTN family beta-propeller protein
MGEDVLYPNRAGGGQPAVTRRQLVAGSAVVGAFASAGCVGDSGSSSDGEGEPDDGTPAIAEADSVFVFNTADGTASVVDVETDRVVGTPDLGLTASFPSNQYSPALTETAADPLWLNVGDGIRALSVGSLETAATVGTGSGANWLEQTPDGQHVIVSAREPAHRQLRVDGDPSSETFGEATATIDRRDEGGLGDSGGPGPCDVTIHPDGRYAYVPDLFGDTLTVVEIEQFEIASQIGVEPVVGETARPWMATIAPDGETLLVEHDEGEVGTESVWDLSDPAAPVERVRITAEDGLGTRPLTSEIGPGGEVGFVFTPGSDDVTAIDLAAGTVLDRIDLGGSAFVGTWDPAHERLYVPVQTDDAVAVVDPDGLEVTTRIDVGSSPYGATAARVRPAVESLATTPTAGAIFRNRMSREGTSYCVGNCDCGHRL